MNDSTDLVAETPIDSRHAWRSLAPKLRKFVDQYAKTGSVKEAEQAAGWAPGCGTAYKHMQKPLVRAAIEARRREFEFLGLVETSQVINELKTIAFTSPEDLKDPKPTHDHKLRALEMLGRSQKLFTDRIDLSGGITLAQLVKASYTQGVAPDTLPPQYEPDVPLLPRQDSK